MPIGPTKTKAQKQKVVHTEMHKFKEGDLHSGSKKGKIVTNPKQAIAIGLSESGQSNKKYDRSGHFPGNPGFNREGKPPYRKYDAGAQAKQPKGQSLHYGAPEDAHKPHQSYQAEQREHWGSEAEGKTMKHRGEVAFTGESKRGSHLIEETNLVENHKQPHGKSIGAGRTDIAEHHKGHGMGKGSDQIFPTNMPKNAHVVGNSVRSGHYRLSGHPGAHRIGARKK